MKIANQHLIRLSGMFEDRSEAYAEYTKNIFDQISEVLDGINQYLTQTSIVDPDTHFVDFVAISRADGDDDPCYITGYIYPLVGTTVMSEFGSFVEIADEDIQKSYAKIVRVGVPADEIAKNDSASMFGYLMAMDAENAEDDVETPARATNESNIVNMSDFDVKDRLAAKKILEAAKNPSGILH